MSILLYAGLTVAAAGAALAVYLHQKPATQAKVAADVSSVVTALKSAPADAKAAAEDIAKK